MIPLRVPRMKRVEAPDLAPMRAVEARALAACLREHTRAMRATQPQTYTETQLAERFPGVPMRRIKAVARDRLGYVPRRGIPFVLTLRQFERLCELADDGALLGVTA